MSDKLSHRRVGQDREGFKLIPGVQFGIYSQKDLIRGEKQAAASWGGGWLPSQPFGSFNASALFFSFRDTRQHVLLSLCQSGPWLKMMQGRVNTKEISQLVLNTRTGLPPSSTFLLISVFSIQCLSKCGIRVVGQQTRVKRCLCPPSLLAFLVLPLLLFSLLEQEDECRVKAHPL